MRQRNAYNLSGVKFGRLTAVALHDERPSVYWTCRCDCGKDKSVRSDHLLQGRIQSCGCLALERLIARAVKHGDARTGKVTREHRCWQSMIRRCGDPFATDFGRYGGRGISVCDQWQRYEHFLSDMGRCPYGRTLDRIDNDGNYEPGNCRWATPKQQSRNRRSTVQITFNGETLCATEWAERVGIASSTIISRLRRGWNHERALNQPPRHRNT